MEKTILVTGAGGRLGQELVRKLAVQYGKNNVIASDMDAAAVGKFPYCHFETMNIFNTEHLQHIIQVYKVAQIYHLATILPVLGKTIPFESWNILETAKGLRNILELARINGLERVFWPSSTAVFGQNAQKRQTPQFADTDPDTIYGISKVVGEQRCRQYAEKYGVDIRSLRYPGLIGDGLKLRGEITDYAVDIYRHAAAKKSYTCYLRPDTRLPMIYMPDAVQAALDLMRAPLENIKVRTSYNLAATSFTPAEIHRSICRFYPDFEITYRPDFRQDLADTWPDSIDDQMARRDWGHKSEYDLDAMTEDMLYRLEGKSKVISLFDP
ncbi:MAG: NAD-dependent epimerase/dehydratase family protein [Saonia sp.]